MKTKEQIKAYIENAEWCEKFKANFKEYYNYSLNNYINIHENQDVILAAFIWEITKEGFEYWDKIDSEYLKWYNNEDETKQNDMKTTDEMVAVMTAFKDGKKIECKIIDPAIKDDWKEIAVPAWNWCSCDYRVMEEPKYRPYKSAEELWADVQKHGSWVKDMKNSLGQIHTIYEDAYICGNDSKFCYNEVHILFWADDGTPFGVKIDEYIKPFGMYSTTGQLASSKG